MSTAAAKARLAKVERQYAELAGGGAKGPAVVAAEPSLPQRQLRQSLAALDDLRVRGAPRPRTPSCPPGPLPSHALFPCSLPLPSPSWPLGWQLRTGRGVEDIVAGAQGEEMAYRAAEAERQAQQAAKIADEAAGASQASATIMMRWDALRLQGLPEELAASLEAQRSACASVLARKAALVQYLQAEAARKDEAFAVMLDAQRGALDALQGRMRAQFLEHRDATGAQLRELEAAFLREREELMAAQRRELEALLEARRGAEEGYVESRLAREEAHAAELYATQAADLENHQKLKVKLERDVMLLEQQLEAMKFTYTLNKGATTGR